MMLSPRPKQPEETSYQKRARKFTEFHRANPHIYQEIVAKCREAKAKGFNQWSIEAIINVIRWDSKVKTIRDGSDFKISNNHKSFYAWMVMIKNPDLRGFFNVQRNYEMEAALADKKETGHGKG